MSFDSYTFEHRKALLQLGELLSDDDSKKIVFIECLPRSLEEKSPWEVLSHLEVEGKTTVEHLTRILKAINRQDVAKKAKESIGKLRRKKKDPGCKAVMLKDSLQLAMKHCKILVDQVDYLIFAANKDGNRRIEQMASEAKEKLTSEVQIKLRYASGLFSFQNETDSSDSADNSSLESPDFSPHLVRSCITASELKEAAEKLKKQKGNPVDSNPHAVHRRITGGELKKAAGKLKGSLLHSNPHAIRRRVTGGELKKAAEKLKQQKGSSSQVVSQTPNGNGIPRARQPTQPPSKTQDAQNGSARDSAIDIAEEEDPYTLVDSDEDDDEDPYTLPDPVEATAQQNATPTYENLPLNPEANLPTTVGYRTERATSFSTYSNTGDSGFSDSRAYFKGQPPSSTQHAPYQREQLGLGIDSGTLNATPGYYKSLNLESRVPETVYDDARCQSSN